MPYPEKGTTCGPARRIRIQASNRCSATGVKFVKKKSQHREGDNENGENQPSQNQGNQLPLLRGGLGDAEGADEGLGEEV